MTRHLLLLLFAGASMPLPAYSQTQGVPFQQLQRQIDQLRERIHTLETTRPNAQHCPEGQFVTGFSSTGVIVCAAPATTPPPPPPPPPIAAIPESFKSALQQALETLTGQDRALQTAPQSRTFAGIEVTYQPMSYDLAIGVSQISQPSATTATIQVPVPAVSLDIAVETDRGTAGTITGTAAGLATVQVTVLTTASGARRLGTVSAVSFASSSVEVTGIQEAFGSLAPFVAPFADTIFLDVLEAAIPFLVDPVLPVLAEF